MKENDNILDTKEQVELLQQYLDSVKTTENTAEINKCMDQLLNLKKSTQRSREGQRYIDPLTDL